MRLTICRYMPGVTNNKVRYPRRFNLKFSNAWHEQSETVVKDEGYRTACESKGIRVYSPEEIIRSHLPAVDTSEEELNEYLNHSPEYAPVNEITDHPNYHHVPCKIFNTMTRLIKHAGLDQAKVLTNSVQVEDGLPKRLTEKIAEVPNIVKVKESEEMMKDILLESRVFDATQKKLPKNKAVRNINWDPVIDRMHRPLPYEKGDFSWGRNVRREYGIPQSRKNLGTIRSIMYAFDRLATDYPALMKRQHIEKSLIRQYFTKDDHYVQVEGTLDYLVTDEKPVEPYAKPDTVLKTKDMPLPDLNPLNSLSYLFDSHIYKDVNSFPVESNICSSLSDSPIPHIHTCFQIYNGLSPRMEQDVFGRSLILAFANTLAQARLKYGPDFVGDLPEPIAIHFVNSSGSTFHFSVFQLNTLNLNSDIKNIFWHQPQMEKLFDTCEYVNAVPTIEGYNHLIFNKLLGIYLQFNAREIQK